MGIILKKKPSVQSTAPTQAGNPVVEQKQELTERQKAHLIEAGLLPPETPPPAKKTITINKGAAPVAKKKYHSYTEGEKVVIVNDLYTWQEWWKPGDTAVVKKYSPPVPEARNDGLKYGVLIVKLDKPRVKGREEVYLHAWEVDRVPA